MISGVSRDFYPGHGRRKWKPEDRKTDRQKERKKERKRRREKEEKGKREREKERIDWAVFSTKVAIKQEINSNQRETITNKNNSIETQSRDRSAPSSLNPSILFIPII